MTANTSSYGVAGQEQRPVGIVLLAAVVGINGVLGAYFGYLLLGEGAASVIVGALLLGVSLGELGIAYGLLTLEPWAYSWGLILLGTSFGLNAVLLLLSGSGATFGVVLSGAAIVYLRTKTRLYR